MYVFTGVFGKQDGLVLAIISRIKQEISTLQVKKMKVKDFKSLKRKNLKKR